MNLLDKIWMLFKKKQLKKIVLDPDYVKEHHTVKALANENAELKGELAKLKSDIGKQREREQDLEEEAEVRVELNKQKKELERKKYPKYFSLKAFFNKYRVNKNFRDKIAFYSFDRSKKIASFGDFGFSSDGDFVALSNDGEVLLKVENPNAMFQSVGGLGSDIMSMKIPLNVTPNGEYIENIMKWEPPELIPTLDGKFQYAIARKKPLYEYLTEQSQKMQDLYTEIENLELTNTKLQKENDELKISQRVSEDSAETARKELSISEGSVSAIDRQFRAISTELAKVRDTNTLLEEGLTSLESQMGDMRKKAERKGVKLSDDVAMETIQRIRRELVRDEPEKVVVKQEN
jgi:chromosome segregation ATPase